MQFLRVRGKVFSLWGPQGRKAAAGCEDAVPRLQKFAVGFKRLVLPVRQLPNEQGLFAVFFPNNAPVVADVVLVIFQQLFLTGPCHRWPVRGNRGMSDERCMVNIYLKEDKKF